MQTIASLVLAAAVLPAPPLLHPMPAAAPVRVAEPVRVEIRTEDDLKLVASFWEPKKRKKQTAPGALIVHDAGGKRQDLDDFAQRLQKQGFAVLAIDLRGHGDSASDQWAWEGADEKTRERLWAFAMRDLQAGADFLRKHDDVHAASLSLLGHRAGGSLAARHAIRDENVRSLVLVDPIKDAMGFDLEADLRDLGGLPTYIAVEKGAKDGAMAMAHSSGDGMDFIEVAVFKGVSITPVKDKRMTADISRWMWDEALPRGDN